MTISNLVPLFEILYNSLQNHTIYLLILIEQGCEGVILQKRPSDSNKNRYDRHKKDMNGTQHGKCHKKYCFDRRKFETTSLMF